LALTALVTAPLLIAPPVIRGLAAAAWVNHFASMDALPRPRKAAARSLIEKTDLAIQNLAPLPPASVAALTALEIGQRTEHEDRDPEAALIVYEGVRAACARVRSRPVSGPGFAVIEARAAALQDAARARGAR
jgi:hypothetical protein